MKFMLLIYGDEKAAASAGPEDMQAVAAAYDEFTKSIIDSGNFLDADPLESTASASTVVVGNGWNARPPGSQRLRSRDRERNATHRGPILLGGPQVLHPSVHAELLQPGSAIRAGRQRRQPHRRQRRLVRQSDDRPRPPRVR